MLGTDCERATDGALEYSGYELSWWSEYAWSWFKFAALNLGIGGTFLRFTLVYILAFGLAESERT